MASEGPRSAGAGASDASYGTAIWYNPEYITGSDGNYALAHSAGTPSGESRYLKASSFGFTVPSSAVIEGIIVEIERRGNKNTVTDHVEDDRVRIVKGGVVSATDKADTGVYWPTSDTYKSYGSSSDLWGETWTYSDINSSDFGVVLASKNYTSDGSIEARVDHIRITVYYSTGLSVSVSDSPSSSESVQTHVTSYQSISSDGTLSESVGFDSILEFSVSDSASITETSSGEKIYAIIVQDSLTPSEVITFESVLDISASDSGTFSESTLLERYRLKNDPQLKKHGSLAKPSFSGSKSRFSIRGGSSSASLKGK